MLQVILSLENKHALEVKGVCEQGQFTLDLLRECAHIYSAKNGDVFLPLADGAGAYYPAGPTRGLVSVARGGKQKSCCADFIRSKTVEALAALYRSSLWKIRSPVALRVISNGLLYLLITLRALRFVTYKAPLNPIFDTSNSRV